MNMEWEGHANTASRENPVDCPGRQHNAHYHQVIWQDSVDLDNMNYKAQWLGVVYSWDRRKKN